ncbi:uncharacterized protein LOC123221717 [Mangifera indica]|uniref:uncharacterized protein LOC123205715 n=1 Tax=Mangifera indica TaxID=29780 RepID=UPI001CFBF579|nr:uncharacterized protein LOC123205715 [Mangifera indica]XP_044500554.1 uncharacterized protein LOC123221717 [Mangifera indica]
MDSPFSDQSGISRGRDAPPSHYLLKIKSFSMLSEASILEYTSDKFESGGYQWKLSLYPNGDKFRDGRDHISIYLALAEMNSLHSGWEINVVFNFFILNQLQNKYFIIQEWRERRFHAMKTEWGIAKFIDLETFCNPLNGFLIEDTCVFGAEVFVVKSTFKGECLSMIKQPTTCYYSWKLNNFSFLADQRYNSESFGDYNWNIILYPKGNGEFRGSNISIYLTHARFYALPDKFFLKFILRVKDQINGEDLSYQTEHLFSPSQPDWGYATFMSLAKLKDPKMGYLVDDSLIIEAEVTLLGLIKPS